MFLATTRKPARRISETRFRLFVVALAPLAHAGERRSVTTATLSVFAIDFPEHERSRWNFAASAECVSAKLADNPALYAFMAFG